MNIDQQIIAVLQKLVALYSKKTPVGDTPSNQQIISTILLKYLGTRCTLDRSIPIEVQCAEAVSFLLAQMGINDGTKGIAGTAALLDWVLQNSWAFEEVHTPELGALLISATGTGNGLIEGHTGFFGGFGVMYPNDYGIVSNKSSNGLLSEHWNYTQWTAYYTVKGGIKPRMFRIIKPIHIVT